MCPKDRRRGLSAGRSEGRLPIGVRRGLSGQQLTLVSPPSAVLRLGLGVQPCAGEVPAGAAWGPNMKRTRTSAVVSVAACQRKQRNLTGNCPIPHCVAVAFYSLALLILFLLRGVTGDPVDSAESSRDQHPDRQTVIGEIPASAHTIWSPASTTPERVHDQSNVTCIKDLEEPRTLNGIRSKIFFIARCNLDLRSHNRLRDKRGSGGAAAGIQAAVIVQYNASSVPVRRIALSFGPLAKHNSTIMPLLPPRPAAGADPRR